MDKGFRFLLASILCLIVAACGGNKADGPTVISLWRHQVGDLENAATNAMIDRFNGSQGQWRIEGEAIPQQSYPQSVMAAAVSGRMPCILTVDHPMVPSFVWAGHLRTLEGRVSPQTFEGVSRAALGVYRDRIYSVGQFDAVLAIYARRDALAKINVRMPTVEAPWTLQEFDALLAGLKATGDYRYVLDLGTRDPNPNWWTYGFSPMLQSFGGDLIDRGNMQSAEGTLNGPAALAWGIWFQSLFTNGYVNKKEPDDRAFLNGRVALNYSGNWWAHEYAEVLGTDAFVILPPPDLGRGTVVGGGSWQWGISSTCEHEAGAAAFIEFLMQTEEIVAMSAAAGMIPVTEAAAAQTEKFREGGEWRIFFDLMQAYSLERPATPAFTTISNAFYRNARDIMDGKNVQDALDDAVDDIDRAIEDNGGFKISSEASQ